MPPDEAGDVLTVKHLAQEVCIETGVDLWNQVLTFKGWIAWLSSDVPLYSGLNRGGVVYCTLTASMT